MEKDFKEIATQIQQENVNCYIHLIETTPDWNGYPTKLEYGLIGFNYFDDIEEYAQEYDLRVTTFQRKKGSKIWTRINQNTTEPLRKGAEHYGDNYHQWTNEDEEEYFKTYIRPMCVNCDDYDELESFLKEMYETLCEICNAKDDEIVITCNTGNKYLHKETHFETIKKEAVEWYDYANEMEYAIGLMGKSH